MIMSASGRRHCSGEGGHDEAVAVILALILASRNHDVNFGVCILVHEKSFHIYMNSLPGFESCARAPPVWQFCLAGAVTRLTASASEKVYLLVLYSWYVVFTYFLA